MPKISAIVFDFDGVLADTERLHLVAFQQVFATRGWDLDDATYYDAYLGYDEIALVEAYARDRKLDIGHAELRAVATEKIKLFERHLVDTDVLYPAAREYAHYPGGHNEGYPDGPKNFFRNVYGFIAGARPGGDFSTFVDGHNEIAICDAVLKSSSERRWVDVEY